MNAPKGAGGGHTANALARFKPTGRGNEFLDCGDFGISFNPGAGFLGMSVFAQDGDDGETAIVLGDKYEMANPYLILNGDFRRELAECADKGGLEACVEFFAARPELQSSWSNEADAARAALAKAGGES